jgi:predicted  nucleic acid-binding Zn-ribbon protein
MSVTALALRELHRIHRQITDLKSQLARGPKQIRAAEGLLERLDTAVAAAKQALTHTKVTADDRQLQLRHREDRIKDLQLKLNQCGSNREYQALKEQIAADQQANSVLSDEILEALEKIDELQAQFAKAQADRNKAAEQLEALRADAEAHRGQLEAELRRVTAELAAAERALPADFKAEYERLARARGESAMAQVDGETCSSCFQTLTTQTINDLVMARPVVCRNCGALLYLPEGYEQR